MNLNNEGFVFSTFLTVVKWIKMSEKDCIYFSFLKLYTTLPLSKLAIFMDMVRIKQNSITAVLQSVSWIFACFWCVYLYINAYISDPNP